MATTYPFLLAGRWERSEQPLEVHSPYSGELVGTTYNASAVQLEEAIAAAVRAFSQTRRLAASERAAALEKLRAGLLARRDEFARTITREAGKPIKDARVEVDRGLLTLQTAAEEAKRQNGEIMPLDWLDSAKGRLGLIRRYPVGPILAITPFNFPLNLVLHKLAPAIASGNPILVKPADKTPLTAMLLAELVAEAGLPAGAVSIFSVARELFEPLVTDDRFKLLTFTGSAAVGWQLKSKAGRKRVTLELGGNAGVVVDEGADLDMAVPRLVAGGYGYAGQSCISVQRVYVHQRHWEDVSERFVAGVRALKLGDPLDDSTDVGPLIDKGAAQRTAEWVAEAVQGGATVLTGGQARGPIFEPTVLSDVPPTAKVCAQEVFAPVVDLFPFQDFRAALAEVNRSEYGLQAGLFTPNLEHAFCAFDELEVGGVIVNDVPTWRMDPMPYGGVKASGLGREGLRYAIEDMTEIKIMALNRLTPKEWLA